MLEGIAGQPIPVSLTLPGGETGRFPQATFLDGAGVVIATADLAATATDGHYVGAWPSATVGHWRVLFRSFTDAGHTISDPFYDEICAEDEVLIRAVDQDAAFAAVAASLASIGLDVDNLELAMAIVQGLCGFNSFDEVVSRDGNGNPAVLKKRLFPDDGSIASATEGALVPQGEFITIIGDAAFLNTTRWRNLRRTAS